MGGPPMGAPMAPMSPPANAFPPGPGRSAPAPSGNLAFKLIPVVIALFVISSVGWYVVYPLVTGTPDSGTSKLEDEARAEVKKLGTKYEAANPNTLIKNLKKRAKKWRKDARFYAFHINGLKNNGTIDLSKSGNMTVEFFSPALISSSKKSKRDKAMRKYVVGKYKVEEEVWGVDKRYDKDIPATPTPKCKFKKVGKFLKKKGMKKKKQTASVSLDPKWANLTKGLKFNINVSKPKLHLKLDIHSCKEAD